eukprot:m.923316 g.923316  ORF g.923316 m.923316 type:complete len:219 (-) comp23766_c1_seq2:504-1160(-)
MRSVLSAGRLGVVVMPLALLVRLVPSMVLVWSRTIRCWACFDAHWKPLPSLCACVVLLMLHRMWHAGSQEQHHKDARSDVAVRGRKAMAKRARAHHHPVRDDDVAARVTNDHVDGAGADEAAIDGNALAQRLHMNAKVNPGRFNRKPAPGAGNDDAAVRSQRAQPPRARDASILVRLQSSIADVLFAVAGIVAAFYSLSYLMTVCNSRSPRKAPSKLV